MLDEGARIKIRERSSEIVSEYIKRPEVDRRRPITKKFLQRRLEPHEESEDDEA